MRDFNMTRSQCITMYRMKEIPEKHAEVPETSKVTEIFYRPLLIVDNSETKD